MLRLTGAIAALCMLVGASAAAQDAPAGAWTDPLGRFSVDFAASGFTPLPRSSDPSVVLEVENVALQTRTNSARTCAVQQLRIPRVSAFEQGEANARLYTRTEADLRAELRGQLSEYVRSREAGISMLSFRLDTGTVQQYWRYFFLTYRGSIVQTSVVCGGTAPLGPLEIDIMNQTLSTLRFLPEASP